MVRDVFRLAKENAPAIVFIDEVDAIATARFDAQTGADREVQRILMELLNQVECKAYVQDNYSKKKIRAFKYPFCEMFKLHYELNYVSMSVCARSVYPNNCLYHPTYFML